MLHPSYKASQPAPAQGDLAARDNSLLVLLEEQRLRAHEAAHELSLSEADAALLPLALSLARLAAHHNARELDQ